MFCPNCGKPQENPGAFCVFCGSPLESAPLTPTAPAEIPPAAPVQTPPAPVEMPPIVPVMQQPVAPIEPIVTPQSMPMQPAPAKKPKKTKAPKQAKAPKKAKKARPGLIILFVFLGLILAAVTTAAVLMFPAEITIGKPKETVTKTGVLEDIKISITANQPVTEVKYAFMPKDSDDLTQYKTGKLSGTYFQKSLTISQLEVPPGQGELYVYVKTWFGESTRKYILECDIGYVAVPTEDQILVTDDGTMLISNELILTFGEDVSEKKAEDLIDDYDGEIVGQLYVLNQYQVQFDVDDLYELEALQEELAEESIVDAVSCNLVYQDEVQYFPDDSEYDSWDESVAAGNNWGLECIEAPAAWEYNNKLESVKVGVLDSFVDYDHPDLKIDPDKTHAYATEDFPTMKSIHEFFDSNNDSHRCVPKCGYCSTRDHGTHVSGIIGARGDNDKGVAGVNWKANLYFANAWTYETSGGDSIYSWSSNATINYGIAYLAMNGCRVINMSLGSTYPSTPTSGETVAAETFELLITRLEDMGYDFLICKAAGNSTANASNYQLNRIMTYGERAKAHVLIVAAIQGVSGSQNRAYTRYPLAYYSNYGNIVEIAAPGSNIYSTVFDGYGYKSGTSMATPMVAGTASLLYALEPELTSQEVKDILLSQHDLTTGIFTESGNFTYPIVNARMAVEYVLENGSDAPDPVAPTGGFLTGLVQDAASEEIIEEASIELTATDSGTVYYAQMEVGTYNILLDPGTYNMKVTAPGYMDDIIYNIVITEGVVTYNPKLQVVDSSEEEGVASGRIVDAFDASSISYAEIKIYRGVNNTAGSPVTTTHSDSSGYYSVELAPGNYTIRASASGYTSGNATILVLPDTENYDQDCTLTPTLNDGEIRAVLTWGRYPADLDSHLSGPAPNGTFHIFYNDMKYSYGGGLYCRLDVDDTTSYGPETTSVYIPLSGTYTYSVHDYTNRHSSSSSDLANSGAQVKVYVGGTEDVYVFNVPTGSGTVWEVFSVTDGVLTPINTMYYESDPRDVGP